MLACPPDGHLKLLYMNGLLCARFSGVLTDRIGCASIFDLVAAYTLRVPMKAADSHLIPLTSSKLIGVFRFCGSRSNLVCHHI
jgi:hypothetical protein